MIHHNLEKALKAAFDDAQMRRHQYFTLEHLLFSLLHTEDGAEIIVHTGGDVDEMMQEVDDFLDTIEINESTESEPVQTVAFQRMLEKVILHSRFADKKEIEIGDIFVSFFNEDECYAKYFLEKQGITRLDVLNYISHGISKIDDLQFDDDSIDSFQEGGYDAVADQENDLDGTIFVENEPGKDRKSKAQEKIIQHFTINMSQMALDGKYDRLIGRESELRRTIEILCRRNKNNPIHVGEPGVGKTAITEGLAQMIVENRIPDRLSNFTIYGVDMGSMLAGTKYRGEFEERIKNLFQALKNKGQVIVFIDEIHTIVGAGSVQGSSMDASNLLKPLLASGELRCIGSTTYEEYKQHFEKDRALTRRFQRVEIKEPSVGESVAILNGLKDRYEQFHNVSYSKNAIKSACELSAKFINDRHLPDKAIDVMDEVGASVSIYHPKRRSVTVQDVERLVAKMAKIPIQSVSQQERSSLERLFDQLNETVFGQQDAISKIVSAVKRQRAGLANPEKPVGSFLFVGPTGVGKTELCRRLASNLGVELLRFDMSEYMEKHTISRLLGSPPGYVGFDQGAMLTDAIRRNPHAVLLLDEIEKAHPDIFNALLQVMDHATITDNTGRPADFRNIILIMTSNVGSREMSSIKIGFSEGNMAFGDPLQAVKKLFSPEFRNRLDDIVVFGHLDRATIEKIVHKFINELQGQLKIKRITLEILPEAVAYLADTGYSPEFGARPMARLIQHELNDQIVDQMLFGKLQKGGHVMVGIQQTDLGSKLDIRISV